MLQNTANIIMLDDSGLAALTEAKGHHSLCLYFSIANPDFGPKEAKALIAFGRYMQYMDDLEDFYEDRCEGRSSPVPSLEQGFDEAERLLHAARTDLAAFYNDAGYAFDFVWDKILFYHRAIRFACIMRERSARLPRRARKMIHRTKEEIGRASCRERV